MNEPIFYTLRCLKCSCHFSNIITVEGIVKVEKKCPKCKCLNVITLSNKEINIRCQLETENMTRENDMFNAKDEEY